MKRVRNSELVFRKVLPLMLGVVLILGVLVITGYFKPVLAFDGYPLAVRAAFQVDTDCFDDADGANDESGQKDLTRACIESASKDPIHVTWNWDITKLTGANTADGCALFDTDLNGFTDYAICNSWKLSPPVKTEGYPVLYACNDTRSDRCAGGVVTPMTTTICSIALATGIDPYKDPFLAGDSYPYDAISECYIALADVGSPQYPVNLLNVCSYPSLQPNSDPSDCVITSETKGNLEVHKDVVPDDVTTNWNISVTGPTTFTDVLTGDDTTYNKIVIPGSYTISESAGANTSPGYTTTWVCTNSAVDPAVVTSGIGKTISNLSITAGSVWDCTFTNRATADIKVTKTDSVTSYPWMKKIDTPFMYTIRIEHVYTTPAVTAENVSLVDTLDPWLDYISDRAGYAYTVKINDVDISPTPVCNWVDDAVTDGRGGTFSCANLGNLASTQVATVTFWVVPVNGAPVYSYIENGICTQNPSMQGTNPVDICNLVSVATTSVELTTTNNVDSEPADIGVPLAVELSRFEVSKVGRKGIFLQWETVSEQDVAGFNIYRSGKSEKMNRLITPDLIAALYPGELTGAVYTFIDANVKPAKTYYYWLEAIGLDGSVEIYGPVSARLNR